MERVVARLGDGFTADSTYIGEVTTRHLAPLLAVAAALALACGGSSSSASKCPSACPLACDSSGKCPAVQCPSSCPNSCDSTGKCVALTCTQDMKPVTASEAASIGLNQKTFSNVQVGTVLKYAVPANTVSLTIVEQARKAPDGITSGGVAYDNTAVPFTVTDPKGVVAYNDLQVPTTDPDAIENALIYFGSNSPATGTMTFPNSTGGLSAYASGLPSGEWSITVGDYAYECTAGVSCSSGAASDSVYDVTVIPKLAKGTKLDVTFWVATAKAEFTTADPKNDPAVTRLLATLKNILAGSGSGITLNQVTFQALSADLQAAYDQNGINVDESGGCADLAQLLKHSASGFGNTVNVFLVSNLIATSGTGNTQVVGIDGTIPGPATFAGTVASGVAASVADLHINAGTTACTGGINIDTESRPNTGCGADLTAYVIAHEIGHTLGLFHVTEGTGAYFDSLQTTPRCPCSTCNPTPSTCKSPDFTGMDGSMCSNPTGGCGGADNLMFWLLETGAVGNLKPEQGAVMQLNPLVH